MTATMASTDLAILDGDGAVVRVGPSLPALTVEDAERLLPLIEAYRDNLERLEKFARDTVLVGWRERGQNVGLIGGVTWERKQKASAYRYDAPAALMEELRPFVGRVITEDELVAAVGFATVPEQVIPAHVEYAPATVKLDALSRKSKEIERVVAAHRDRDLGVEVLVKKSK